MYTSILRSFRWPPLVAVGSRCRLTPTSSSVQGEGGVRGEREREGGREGRRELGSVYQGGRERGREGEREGGREDVKLKCISGRGREGEGERERESGEGGGGGGGGGGREGGREGERERETDVKLECISVELGGELVTFFTTSIR